VFVCIGEKEGKVYLRLVNIIFT